MIQDNKAPIMLRNNTFSPEILGGFLNYYATCWWQSVRTSQPCHVLFYLPLK